ncbi:MAG: hypothetical protein PVF43_15495, partial [Candidatus Eiseniibacteriota bacterium]
MDFRLRMTAAVACSLVVLLASTVALAVQAPTHGVDYEITPSIEQSLYLTGESAIAADTAARAYGSRLTAELGEGWWLTSWNQFARSPRSVAGRGVVVAPGGLAGAEAGRVEAIARGFIAEHPALFGTDGSNLATVRVTHGASRWGVILQQVEDDVPVLDAYVVIALHDNGRLFGFGADVYQTIDVSTVPTLDPAVARALARSAVPFDPQVELAAGGDARVIVPVHVAPGSVDYHLAHRTDVPTSEPLGIWRTYVDAHDGRILYRTNEVHHLYEGEAAGDVEVFSYCDGDTPDLPAAHMTVTVAGVGSVDTDENGDFSLPGDIGATTYSAQFYGPDFNVNCSGCTDGSMSGPIQPGVPAALYWDAANYRADERDTFYFANLTKDFIQAIDPVWNLPRYTATVNINDACNAFWTGTTINFFREAGGCANTGTIGDVI